MCGQKIGHARLPLFWRVRIERYGVKIDAVQRQTGLAMMLDGHAALAAVMGPDEDMAEKILSKEITVCEDCAMRQTVIAVLAEDERNAPAI